LFSAAVTATQNGQTLAITCVVSSEQLPTGDGTVVDVDAARCVDRAQSAARRGLC
jgi:hypothetical protein